MNGQKKLLSPMPSDAEVTAWKVTLADLQRRVKIQHKAGQFDTVWDAQIEQLEEQIAGANLEEQTDGK